MHARLSVAAGSAAPLFCDLSPTQTASLGRNRSNTIVLKDQHASRLHAEVFYEEQRWLLRDCGATNGTRLNGQRISGTVPLEHGAQISIGDIRLRFTLEAGLDRTPMSLTPLVDPQGVAVSLGDSSSTTLQPDDLSALVQLLNESLKETSPHGLLQLALGVVRRQTGADLCGFLNLDVDNLLPRLVDPPQAEVDEVLSKRLTQLTLKAGRSIWLATQPSAEMDSDSLAAFSDAICIPVHAPQATGAPAQATTPLGALHVYKSQRAFTEQQFRFCEVLGGCLANSLRVLRSRRALEADNSRLRVSVSGSVDRLLGNSSAIQQLQQQIGRLADYSCTVLIIGESGVGKELVALELHHRSSRCEGPLVPVNCAAIVASMPEAELFGHKEGAFTGATCDHPGYFQQADEGTLFLDEIGELSLECQAKLLRVLETKSFRPVGGKRPVTVDVRILAATNRDLEKEVQEGRFRPDLFYRLGMSIKVPPLRQHPEDIPVLVESYLKKLNKEYRRQVSLSESALERLMTYSWPGNVRQLRTVLETAVAMVEGEVILPSDLRLGAETPPKDRPPCLNLLDLEAWAIRQALSQTEGNQVQASQLLGIHRETLTNKMKKYGIERR